MPSAPWYWWASLLLTAVCAVFAVLRWWHHYKMKTKAAQAERDAHNARREADEARREADQLKRQFGEQGR